MWEKTFDNPYSAQHGRLKAVVEELNEHFGNLVIRDPDDPDPTPLVCEQEILSHGSVDWERRAGGIIVSLKLTDEVVKRLNAGQPRT